MQRLFQFNSACLLLFLTCLRPFTLGSPQRTALDSPGNLHIYRLFRIGVYNILGRTGTDARSLDLARSSNLVQKRIPDDVPFPCDVKGWRSSIPPTSVHRLKPGDIDIIASMGDSLSAGTGIFGSNILHLLIDNRGVTAAGGGQGTWREYMTLPNIFKVFNPNLYGYALGDGSTLEESSKFNVAEATAESKDMPYMASVLIKRLRNDPKVDMEKHWKHISLMVGSNDYCTEMCFTSQEEFLESHRRDLIETLRIIRDNVPRVIVSLIPPPHLKELIFTRMGRPSLLCDLTTDFECSCLFGLQYRNKRPEYYDTMTRWSLLEYEISRYQEFQREDFAVVIQPVLMNITVPVLADGYTDTSYLAPDCFHITQKLNALYAASLWNSLLLPVQEKPLDVIKDFDHFVCPTKEHPYLITYVNQGMTENSL